MAVMPWATIITSVGSLLSGLAIIIAFMQLGSQRQDRLRAQVSKVGVWAEPSDNSTQPQVTLFVHNANELPVHVLLVDLALNTLPYQIPNLVIPATTTRRPAEEGYRIGPFRPGHDRARKAMVQSAGVHPIGSRRGRCPNLHHVRYADRRCGPSVGDAARPKHACPSRPQGPRLALGGGGAASRRPSKMR